MKLNFLFKKCFSCSPSSQTTNPLGIQMISNSLNCKLFPKRTLEDPEKIKLSKEHLKAFDLWNKNLKPMPDINIEHLIPPLLSTDPDRISVDEHFKILGLHQREPIYSLATNFHSLPQIPTEWMHSSGWVKYTNSTAERVPFPDESAIVFDTEVLYKLSPYPVMAIAASKNAWYSWISPIIFSSDNDPKHNSLIPLGNPETQKLIIGHHVAYDRARILEEYSIKESKYQFIDTLSLHSTIGGLSSQQRGAWLTHKKMIESEDYDPSLNLYEYNWKDVGSANNLKDIYKLYTGKHLSKKDRDEFSTTDIDSIKDPAKLSKLLTYCANDVLATHQVYKVVLPKFLLKCPHPVSFAGMLHMSKGYLTVTEDWKKYIQLAEKKCSDFQKMIESKLMNLAYSALDDTQHSENQWLRNLDYTITPPKRTKKTPIPFDPKSPILTKKHLALSPQWFKELWDSKQQKIRLTTSKRVSPYLLQLQWKGFPLYYSSIYGWTYVVPKSLKRKTEETLLEFSLDETSEKYDSKASLDELNYYYRIPHPDGEGKNCGNPLSRSFLAFFEDGTLTSSYKEAKEILKLNASCSYWVSARQRISEQFVIWNDSNIIGDITGSEGEKMGVIVPQSIVMGTVTRRAVDPTWMTAANAKANRIGSELKAQIKAPKGYCFVGADVDSQELWIASLLGDSQFGIHGATAIGFMTLQGSKAMKTDLHSVTGDIIGVSRDSAKVFNYSRIYGAGLKHAVQLLLKNSSGCERNEAERKVVELYAQTKGRKYFKKNGGSLSQNSFWYGGTESFMFNSMEIIATSSNPRTPVLNCGIPDSLLPQNVGNEYMPSRVNWVVQSSGVDYLHLLLVSMKYFIERMNIQVRFLLSIHDEVRFLVKEEHQNHAALALQISNLFVRALFSQKVGICDLPLNVAFFSSVDIDFCLRKEVDMECITPSNSMPIASGISVDIYKIVDHFKGKNYSDLFGPEIESITKLISRIENIEEFVSSSTASDTFVKIQMATNQNEIKRLFNSKVGINILPGNR